MVLHVLLLGFKRLLCVGDGGTQYILTFVGIEAECKTAVAMLNTILSTTCDPNLCVNGACDEVSLKCNCQPGWSGVNCDAVATTTTTTTTIKTTVTSTTETTVTSTITSTISSTTTTTSLTLTSTTFTSTTTATTVTDTATSTTTTAATTTPPTSQLGTEPTTTTAATTTPPTSQLGTEPTTTTETTNPNTVTGATLQRDDPASVLLLKPIKRNPPRLYVDGSPEDRQAVADGLNAVLSDGTKSVNSSFALIVITGLLRVDGTEEDCNAVAAGLNGVSHGTKSVTMIACYDYDWAGGGDWALQTDSDEDVDVLNAVLNERANSELARVADSTATSKNNNSAVNASSTSSTSSRSAVVQGDLPQEPVSNTVTQTPYGGSLMQADNKQSRRSYDDDDDFDDDDDDLQCSSGCPSVWQGDGYCDAPCDNLACGYDNGDCVTPNTATCSSRTRRMSRSEKKLEHFLGLIIQRLAITLNNNNSKTETEAGSKPRRNLLLFGLADDDDDDDWSLFGGDDDDDWSLFGGDDDDDWSLFGGDDDDDNDFLGSLFGGDDDDDGIFGFALDIGSTVLGMVCSVCGLVLTGAQFLYNAVQCDTLACIGETALGSVVDHFTPDSVAAGLSVLELGESAVSSSEFVADSEITATCEELYGATNEVTVRGSQLL
eukprot:gene1962-31262_t